VLTVGVEHLLSLGQAGKRPDIATALKMRFAKLRMGVLSGGPTPSSNGESSNPLPERTIALGQSIDDRSAGDT
jgi:hypothetical protein